MAADAADAADDAPLAFAVGKPTSAGQLKAYRVRKQSYGWVYGLKTTMAHRVHFYGLTGTGSLSAGTYVIDTFDGSGAEKVAPNAWAHWDSSGSTTASQIMSSQALGAGAYPAWGLPSGNTSVYRGAGWMIDASTSRLGLNASIEWMELTSPRLPPAPGWDYQK